MHACPLCGDACDCLEHADPHNGCRHQCEGGANGWDDDREAADRDEAEFLDPYDPY